MLAGGWDLLRPRLVGALQTCGLDAFGERLQQKPWSGWLEGWISMDLLGGVGRRTLGTWGVVIAVSRYEINDAFLGCRKAKSIDHANVGR